MYLSELENSNFRQFGSAQRPFTLALQPGVTALVGENDCGKTAVVDAIRYALLTRDLDYVRVQPDDFYIDATGEQATDITIRCKLSSLSDADRVPSRSISPTKAVTSRSMSTGEPAAS